MGIVSLPSFGSDPVTVNAANLDGKVDPLATEFNGGIDNDNIASDAAIGNSKLNLATITQNITHSGTMSHTGVVTITKNLKLAKGADVASANALTLGTDGNYFDITGTTAITSIGTLGVGTVVKLHFDGALTLTHHSTDLVLPGGANITTAAGDECELVEYATGDWRCTDYTKADGTSIVATAVTAASQAEMEAATNNTKTVTPLAVNWHPGVAKAYGVFDGSGTPAFSVRYNMDASITDNGTGDYTVAITTDFSSASWVPAGYCFHSGNTARLVASDVSGPAGGTLRINTQRNDGTLVDATVVALVCFGDQA